MPTGHFGLTGPSRCNDLKLSAGSRLSFHSRR